MNIDLKALIAKLNHETRNAVEGAAGLCLSRTHYDVEIEHFLSKLLDRTEADLGFILRHFQMDRSRLAKELTVSLDRLKTGNARTPALSPSLVKMLAEAWSIASVNFGARQIRSGHAILALALNDELRRLMAEELPEFAKLNAEELKANFAEIVAESAEEGATEAVGAETSGGPVGGGKTPNLDQYTIDLTARAEAGEIDPVLGRDFEIRQVVDILTRRRQNNPILVGEAGVGKTAIVEGFATRLAAGEVPPVLRNVRLHTLDLALLQAGAGVKGEFENRLKNLINEVKSSETPIILFIDEAHTMIGAGGAAGQNDAANLLKPALARGELRTIAATTWSEYKKFFEKDPALSRRFQLVKVDEPSEEVCMVMMRGIVPSLERHHGVRILDSGAQSAVHLSHRYLPDRQLPDAAVSVLDTACARLSLGQNATPAAIEDAQRVLDDLDVQERVLKREEATGADHAERLRGIATQRAATNERLSELEGQWGLEKELVEKITDLRVSLERWAAGEASPPSDEGAEVEAPSDPEAMQAELATLTDELETLQGETPLVPVCVDGELVGQVISGWTGIPVGKMLSDEVATVLELERHLGKRVVGQDHALDIISQRIRTSKAGIEDPDKPVGVFMLVGPSGVGKTETALAVSDLLYGGEHNVITINMSEFQEAHTVSTLKGSPPGYVGYGEGGVLTEAVRRKPHSVVLLDEVEKAHPDVLELFFQVFDKGRMEDGEGREIDFKNTVIILTTNAATDALMALCADPETMPAHDGLVKAIKPELNQTFQPAFLGRTVIIPYFPLADDIMKNITRLKLGKVERRLFETHKVLLQANEAVVDQIVRRCTEVESGARNIDNILTNTLLPDVSRMILQSLVDGGTPSRIEVTVGDDEGFMYETAHN